MSQLYTLEEVKPNNGKNGAKTWIVIHDTVYDVTQYLKDHPGGDDLIIDEGGKDCTKVFDDFGHSNDAKQIMKQFKIGELVEEDKRLNRSKADFKSEKVDENADIVKKRRKFKFLFCM